MGGGNAMIIIKAIIRDHGQTILITCSDGKVYSFEADSLDYLAGVAEDAAL